MWGGFGSMMGWGMAWMWVWPVLLLLGLILMGVVAFGLMRGWGHQAAPTRPTAQEILDERYARGEIDAEEYQTRVAGLSR